MFDKIFIQVRGSRSCFWSKITAMEVDSCPESKDENERRAKLKNCELQASMQNCTKPSKFKYHCLINEFESALIEVCAESYFITSGNQMKYIYITLAIKKQYQF